MHARRVIFLAFLGLGVLHPDGWLSANRVAAQSRTTLDIYIVDVEGGNATLFVSPSGQSALIDTGNGGAAATRDAERILDAAHDAGLTQIDHLITTHWHGDHFGAMAELAKRIPIRAFYDHGPTVEPQPASTEFLEKVYPTLTAAGETCRRAAGRSDPRRGARVACGGGGGTDADQAAARRRRRESVLQDLRPERRRTHRRMRSRSAVSSRSGSSASSTQAT